MICHHCEKQQLLDKHYLFDMELKVKILEVDHESSKFRLNFADNNNIFEQEKK